MFHKLSSFIVFNWKSLPFERRLIAQVLNAFKSLSRPFVISLPQNGKFSTFFLRKRSKMPSLYTASREASIGITKLSNFKGCRVLSLSQAKAYKTLLQSQFLLYQQNYVLYLTHFCLPIAWMYFCPRWASRSSDRKCLLGVVLFGAWNSAWWPDAERQDHRRRRRFLQHVFQRDWIRKARSPRRVRRLGADSCWWVKDEHF